MVEDVRVQVHTYDAEMGRTGGGVFNTTARSGINQFHGSGYYQSRPDGAGRAELLQRDPRRSRPNDQYWRNGGGGFGGPIVRGKTFFWAAGEAYRDGQSQNSNLHVPTQAMRNGDFSGLTDCARPADHHLRPADDRRQRQPPAVPWQHHSAEPHQPGRPQSGQRAAAAGRRRRQRQLQLLPTGHHRVEGHQDSLKIDHHFNERSR